MNYYRTAYKVLAALTLLASVSGFIKFLVFGDRLYLISSVIFALVACLQIRELKKGRF